MRCILIFVCLLLPSFTLAQVEYDSTITKNRKNVIRWNITPRILFGANNLVFGYERVLGKHQSLSMNFGVLEFPSLVDIRVGDFLISGENRNRGFDFALDYRRYFKKRNRGLPPDGLYIGPYALLYTFELENSISRIDAMNQSTDIIPIVSKFNVLNIGFELGYQFVFFRRFTLDLIMFGPSLGLYNATLKLDSDFSGDQGEFYDELQDAIEDKFPGLEELLDEGISARGTFSTWTLGLRYVIQIGILF
ncbi:DUF3575 domain-containing protein [Sediminitomix flava]|uniref:Uncharacterized protein DUF3575 n=1 Tax=Sediminitomix flava TaxID=379075 RepID=A0A315ZGM5_SEDFL|nr:DUF3575 domain-containing protein [Sediminitomix flava]PWJ44313.1 uncharacterized protein DUF3575 [Sediminitomix flava]